jgi:hypothetical protein
MYNSALKEIYCVKLTNDRKSASFINTSDISDVFLLFSSSDDFYTNYFDLINKQYFNLILNLHLKGRQISVLCNLAKREINYYEQAYELINFNEPKILNIDSIAFYIESEKYFPKNLKDKEVFINSNIVIDKKTINKDKVNLLLNKDTIISEEILIYKCYLKKSEVSLTQYKNYSKFGPNLYLLFLSQNFQF